MDRKREYDNKKSVIKKRIGSIGTVALALIICLTAGIAAKRVRIKSLAAADEKSELSIAENYELNTVASCGEGATDTAGKKENDSNKEIQTIQGVQSSTSVPESSGFIEKEDIARGVETTAVASVKKSGEIYGGETFDNHWMIPATPAAVGAKPGVRITGEKITDSQAKEYFNKNTWIVSSLASSGVSTDNLMFSENGYCHISYDGTEGKQLELRQNFRDYLVWNNEKLVAIVTLTKENGEINATPAFGGPHFDDYNAFLQKHKGEKLLFIYAGWMEIVITPEGEAVNPQGYDMSGYFDGADNPYEYFYFEDATFTLK
ncbi:MAG: hypothetical protein K6B52_06175 [Clostridiales bacterium]|nr:hypothetical protein [Clostridiales bacterium]